MERSVDRSTTDEKEKDYSLEEQLDKLCVYYMSLGVPYDVFWYGDYCQLKYYEETYWQQRKIENERMWMMGAYNYTAHAVVLSNAFRSKGHKAEEYLKKPIDFFPKSEEEEKQEAEKIKQRVIDNLNRFQEMWELEHVNENSGTGN